MTIHRAINRVGSVTRAGMRFLLTAVLILASSCGDREKDRIALVGGTVIDVNDGSTIPNAVVVIYRTHIETVTPAPGFTIPNRLNARRHRADGAVIRTRRRCTVIRLGVGLMPGPVCGACHRGERHLTVSLVPCPSSAHSLGSPA